MFRSISILDLPETAKLKLKDLGYEYCEDLERALQDKVTIPDDVKIAFQNFKVAKVLNSIESTNVVSAVDLWNSECYNLPVAVFHKGLDKLLKNGFPIGRITEICGAPGSGKTQMCLQAAIDVRIPSELGGSSGESLFISTDFGFKVERLRQMAEESVNHMVKFLINENANEVENFNIETVLHSVNVIKICGSDSLMEVVLNLENYLKTNKAIKLIIIDSFSLPLICELPDLLERTKIIHIMLDNLQELSLKYQFAVLLTNQLTTVITANSEKKLIPSLGESFGHRVHKRILLDDGKACLLKSIDQPLLFTEFQITSAGIR